MVAVVVLVEAVAASVAVAETSAVDVVARALLSTPATSLPSPASAATKLPATHEVLKDPFLG